MIKVFISIDDDRRTTGWGSSPVSDNYIEMNLPENHEYFDAPFSYTIDLENNFLKDYAGILKKAKERKLEELSVSCQNHILGYFEAEVGVTTYSFSFDTEAQSNFIGTLTLFTKGLITEIQWTAHKDGRAERIILNEADFLRVAMVAFPRKDASITRLRKELQPLVENATTLEEVNAIKW